MAGVGRGRRRLHDGVEPVTRHRAGESRVHGRFQQVEGPFVLRAGLKAPGAVPVMFAVDEVKADWQRQARLGLVAASTVTTHLKVLATLGKFMTAQKVAQVCDMDADTLDAWMNALDVRTGEAPTANMVKQRRAVARTFFKTLAVLGITNHDITVAVRSMTYVERVVAPLSVSDVETLKSLADTSRRIADEPVGALKAPAAIALALLGAQTPEIPVIRVRDVRLLDQAVWVHGCSDRYRERWVPIDDAWAFKALMDRVAYLEGRYGKATAMNMAVAYSPGTKRGGAGEENAAAATCNTIDRIMKRAGLKKRKRVRVASITEYVAVRVWAETGRVEAVAERLGMSSLDRAAHLVGYDWRGSFAMGGGRN